MRVVVVYKPISDHAREVRDYLRDYGRFTGKVIQEVNPESRDGADFCRTYGIVEYPTIIALADSGQMQQMWRGRPLPLMDQVSYYDR